MTPQEPELTHEERINIIRKNHAFMRRFTPLERIKSAWLLIMGVIVDEEDEQLNEWLDRVCRQYLREPK